MRGWDMTGKVIQGSFLGGQPKLPPPVPARLPLPIQAKTVARPPGPPTPASAGLPPGPPTPAFAGHQGAVQRRGAGGAFAVEAGQLGLLSGGGRPLPEAVRGKMETALGADFSNVRVHVGPQAERIGAIAFTIGSDIYFAPGRFQPDTAHGQQLLGHELAHVVQQRAGRVRNPLGMGLAVVQDHALEAEADRLGQHAATYRIAAQTKLMPGAAQPSAPVRISPPVSAGPGSYRLTAGAGGRQVGSVMVHARDKGAVEVTDLGVDQTQRGHGIGQMLVASAAKTGLQFGKLKVTLAAQDKGSGHLTQWYKQMGFTQIGVNQRGYPQLEAPISRVLAGTVQRKPVWPGSGILQAANAPTTEQGLGDLAEPKVFRLPEKEVKLQKVIADALDQLVLQGKTPYNPLLKRPEGVFCLGGIVLPKNLDVSSSELVKNAELIRLKKPAGGVKDSYNSIADNETLKRSIVINVLFTLEHAGQLAYLKRSRLTRKKDWKIVVEVHYYQDRVQTTAAFHKDTYGQTLFVNLNYLTGDEIAGPEYILNPPLVEEHEKDIKKSLPLTFRKDLDAARQGSAQPDRIEAIKIPGARPAKPGRPPPPPGHGWVVSFTDELIHHMTPHYGHRFVTESGLKKFLEDKYPYALTLIDQWEKAKKSVLFYRSLSPERREAINLHVHSQYKGLKYDRKQLARIGISEESITELIDKYSAQAAGFQKVSIPNPANPGKPYKAPIRASGTPPLTRRMSEWARNNDLPQQVMGKRRFFRTWVRAVRKDEEL
jgi:GNAT superfamily N-acetyltransferase